MPTPPANTNRLVPHDVVDNRLRHPGSDEFGSQRMPEAVKDHVTAVVVDDRYTRCDRIALDHPGRLMRRQIEYGAVGSIPPRKSARREARAVVTGCVASRRSLQNSAGNRTWALSRSKREGVRWRSSLIRKPVSIASRYRAALSNPLMPYRLRPFTVACKSRVTSSAPRGRRCSLCGTVTRSRYCTGLNSVRSSFTTHVRKCLNAVMYALWVVKATSRAPGRFRLSTWRCQPKS